MTVRSVMKTMMATALVASATFAVSGTATAGVPTCQGSPATAPGHLGDNGNNTIVGTPGPDVLIGQGGNDTIKGKGGADIICGEFDFSTANGKDTLRGGPGLDTLLGNNSADKLYGDADPDDLFGGAGNDLLDGGTDPSGVSGDEVNYIFADATTPITGNLLTGKAIGEGKDTLVNIEGFTGGAANDTFIGNNKSNNFAGGAEFLSGTTGNDTFVGKGGMDTLSFSFATGSNFISLEGGSSVGDGNDSFSSIESVIGSPDDDEIVGSSKPNVLFGSEGHDTIWGRGGDDILIGFGGFDSLFGGEGVADFASYSDTNLSNTVLPVTIDLLDGVAQRSDGDDLIEGIEMIEGSAADDTIIGDHGPNFIYADQGDDEIDGNGGSDLIFFLGATGGVTVDLGLGLATGMAPNFDDLEDIEHVVGSNYADNITGNSKRNFLNGSVGTDWVKGVDGDDYLAGGENNDQIEGGDGNDIMDYFQSNKSVDANLTTGTSTGEGTDTLMDVESLSGTSKGDKLRGNGLANFLYGQNGKDKLFGLGGADRLDGGKAKDSLSGGPAKDTCFTKPEAKGCESFKKPGEHPLTEVGRRYKRALASARRYK